jgi:mono/diheme cytochrome c family protein
MWILNRLPQVWHPFFRNERFNHVTDDAFLLGIEARDRRFDPVATKKLLQDAGAITIDNVHLDPDPTAHHMPKWITAFIVASTAFALIPFAIAAKARTSHSSEPHFHIFPDMDFQPKYKSDQAMDLFDDGRENRGELSGTIARGSLNTDDLFYRGLENGQWTVNFPKQVEVSEPTIRRGKNRFEIYCTPCHGFDGRGMGAIPTRVAAGGGAWQARNLVDASNPVAINMPNGQLFNTISNGYNTMMGYAAQIPFADRWAIVLYVRALQRSQNASLEDIPTDHRSDMQMPEAPSK